MVAQSHACLYGVGQWDATAREISRTWWTTGIVAPTVIRSRIRTPWGRARALAQRGNHQHSDARQPEEVNSGDHQHQLSVARHMTRVARRDTRRACARYHRLPLMARSDTTSLSVAQREPAGSRASRRLRRGGNVPGVLYGGGQDPVPFQVGSRSLRQALAHAGAVLDLSVDGATGTPVVVKELTRHPVSGETVHVDLFRVRLDQTIQTTVVLELTGVESAPGVKDGGVLEHITRELAVEALPTDIPDLLQHDVSEMQIGDTLTLQAIAAPGSVKLLDDPETVIATLSPPRLQVEEDTEIESETEIVGDGEDVAEAEPGGDGGAGAESAGE